MQNKYIEIKGAKIHNLKNIDVNIPRGKLVVMTGLSGSGKSSLAFDTLYAEGQRRYVESLSSYARQFMGKLNKPQVDYIKGISPAVAIEQKVNTKNPRSTVGTSTEIYDYLKLLFARLGKTYSPVSGQLVMRHTVQDVTDFILKNGNLKPVFIITNLRTDREIFKQLELLLRQGFNRVLMKNEMMKLDELLKLCEEEKKFKSALQKSGYDDIKLLIDRLQFNNQDSNHDEEELKSRISDSVQAGFYEGNGTLTVSIDGVSTLFSDKFEADGIEFTEPSVNLFAFNNPYGACKKCEGFGSVIGIDEKLVIPNKNLSLYEGAVACWKGPSVGEWEKEFILKSSKYNFPVHRPIKDLNDKEMELLWNGARGLKGINDFFNFLESNMYKIQYRVMLSRFRGKTVCQDCKGTRLRKDAGYIKIGGKSIQEVVLMPVDECLQWFENLKLTEYENELSKRLLVEIKNRLVFLNKVGLGYLTLNRLSNTLSGGESQRINLATSLGSSLVGSLYVLDEPSIGLHSKDTEQLTEVLQSLKKLGNTVLVVEHDEDIILSADEIIDIGPEAGSNGGKLIFQGNIDELKSNALGITAEYIRGEKCIEIPQSRRSTRNRIKVENISENNLQNVSVEIPLNCLTVVTGVSGSGKTSLVKRAVYPTLQKLLMGINDYQSSFFPVSGSYKQINQVEFVDQNPIGKSSRSNPVTYIKAYDEIRNLFSEQPLSKLRGYKPSHFSFNIDGGRCEVCQGDGEITVEMQFMADIHLQCEACGGKRFKADMLEVSYKNKNIFEVLEMTIDDALEFFSGIGNTEKKIANRLKPLSDVGLGYVHLGQSSSTLSGGEAQRIKLASFLVKGNTQGNTLFIFDEPTTGLHFHDIKKLLKSFDALIENGHSILVIEHNLDVIKCADYIIDMGPGGGKHGGNIVFTGTPEEMIKIENNSTAKYLKKKFI